MKGETVKKWHQCLVFVCLLSPKYPILAWCSSRPQTWPEPQFAKKAPKQMGFPHEYYFFYSLRITKQAIKCKTTHSRDSHPISCRMRTCIFHPLKKLHCHNPISTLNLRGLGKGVLSAERFCQSVTQTSKYKGQKSWRLRPWDIPP